MRYFSSIIFLMSYLAARVYGENAMWPPLEEFLEAEAKHLGKKKPPRNPIISEYLDWLSTGNSYKMSLTWILKESDLVLQHRLAGKFCTEREEHKRCRWSDLYALLNFIKIILPKTSTVVSSISPEDLRAHGSRVTDCAMLPKGILPEQFWGLVVANKPVIFKGLAKNWPARKMWTYEYLSKKLGDIRVVASASPYGKFDTPEDIGLWGSDRSTKAKHVIARPAHLNMTFKEYNRLLRKQVSSRKPKPWKVKGSEDDEDVDSSSSVYLEYFPIPQLNIAEDLNFLKSLLFSNFLLKSYRLLWYGSSSVSSLHFDKNENIMVVVRGAKTFKLFPPTVSRHLYAGDPVITKSYDVEWDKEDDTLQFSRNKIDGTDSVSEHHTYSVIDIADPDVTKKFPKYQKAIREGLPITCHVEEGDGIYVPSNWWHDVTSHPDSEGKTIGVNIFFEPLYIRQTQDLNSKSNLVYQNNIYQHLNSEGVGFGMSLFTPCKSEYICVAKGGLRANNSWLRRKIIQKYNEKKDLNEEL